MSNKYREAGVDLEAGYKSVCLTKNHAARTKVRGAIDSIDTFGGMFDLSVLDMRGPALVSGTDGVDTKLLVTFKMDKHDTAGIDAVIACINSVPVQRTTLIFFLDYLAAGKDEPKKIEQLVKGVADDCMQVEYTLIGGETIEMPGMYDVKHYDIAGFRVGAVDKYNLLDEQKIEKGNILVGLPSTGAHSNGLSLIRKVLLKDAKLDLHREYGEIGSQKLGDVLLIPTKIYIKAIKHLLGKIDIKEISHTTGGDFYENVFKMLKEGQGVTIDITAYPYKPIFDVIAKYGDIPIDEMCNILSMGIGPMMVADRRDVDTVQSLLKEVYEKSYVVGKVTSSGSVDVKW